MPRLPHPYALRIGLLSLSLVVSWSPGLTTTYNLAHAAGQGRKRPTPPRTRRSAPRTRPLPRLPEPSLLLIGRYTKRVYDKIQSKWNTGKLPLMELHRRSATIHLWIKADGSLRKVKLITSSGLPKFDRSLTAAAAAAQPLPRPAPALRKWIHYYGVEVLFRKRVFKRKKVPLIKTYKGSNILYNWQKPKAPAKRPKARN